MGKNHKFLLPNQIKGDYPSISTQAIKEFVGLEKKGDCTVVGLRGPLSSENIKQFNEGEGYRNKKYVIVRIVVDDKNHTVLYNKINKKIYDSWHNHHGINSHWQQYYDSGISLNQDNFMDDKPYQSLNEGYCAIFAVAYYMILRDNYKKQNKRLQSEKLKNAISSLVENKNRVTIIE